MGGGSGTQQSTAQQQQNFAGWAEPIAKAALGTLVGSLFQGATVPNNWFSTKGFSFPTAGATPSQQQAQQNIAQSPLQSLINNPVTNQLLSPELAGNARLQQLAATDPNAVWGAMSPAAAQQMSQLYPSMTGQALQHLQVPQIPQMTSFA